jgi:hypothetical protein
MWRPTRSAALLNLRAAVYADNRNESVTPVTVAITKA